MMRRFAPIVYDLPSYTVPIRNVMKKIEENFITRCPLNVTV